MRTEADVSAHIAVSLALFPQCLQGIYECPWDWEVIQYGGVDPIVSEVLPVPKSSCLFEGFVHSTQS